MRVLVTGAAGFIGYHLCCELLAGTHEVIGVDNLNDYYSPQLKLDRLALLKRLPGFSFYETDIADRQALEKIFADRAPTHVVNLAAQAGVRYSISNPEAYVQSNLVGFANILECCRHYPVEHLVYASSSSVYGLNTHTPYSTDVPVNHPISLYAATKKSNELMAHVYSHLYGVPTTGLRFFTAYGSWGRPDMALAIFTRAILEGKPLPVFNHGQMERDFTYVEDIVDGVVRLLERPAKPEPQWNPDAPNPAASSAPYRVFNIGNNQSVPLLDVIRLLEELSGKKAALNMLPMQAGDVQRTCADVEPLRKYIGFAPATPLEQGIAVFFAWFRSYYHM